MLLIDDLLASPFKGVWWVFKKIHQAAVDELDKRQQQTRGELSELYMQLETGRISEEEFDAKEKELLNRLDQVKSLRERQVSPPPPEGRQQTAPQEGGR
ncbi:MAG: gas vesicle protein GvpG [Deltaproteobacteria bacterium]|nr:gas vesicle protein GvpG [Deltaproteobacteria bacterium]